MTADWLAIDKGDVRVSVHVQPRAGRTEIRGVHGGALKVRLAAPPVDGAANEELVSFLAKRLRVPKSAIRIERGARGRRKTVSVAGLDLAGVRSALTGHEEPPV